jgi:copper chaperone
MTTKLKIEGMTCAHCLRAVKDALEGVSGVRSASVDLDTGIATIEHDADVRALIESVEAEGYQASLR